MDHLTEQIGELSGGGRKIGTRDPDTWPGHAERMSKASGIVRGAFNELDRLLQEEEAAFLLLTWDAATANLDTIAGVGTGSQYAALLTDALSYLHDEASGTGDEDAR